MGENSPRRSNSKCSDATAGGFTGSGTATGGWWAAAPWVTERRAHESRAGWVPDRVASCKL